MRLIIDEGRNKVAGNDPGETHRFGEGNVFGWMPEAIVTPQGLEP